MWTAERFRNGMIVAAIAAGTIVFMSYLPNWLDGWFAVQVAAVGALLFLALYIAVVKGAEDSNPTWRASLVLWWFMLATQQLFSREYTPTSEALRGNFSPAAYGEALSWGMVALGLLVISLRRPAYLRELFSGRYKWVSLFALFCTVSVRWSPRPLSVAWAFKLALVVILLQLCLFGLRDISHIRSFLRATLLAFLLLAIVPLIQSMVSSHPMFEHQRLSADVHPVQISQWGGAVLLLALILFALDRRTWLIPCMILGATIMVLGGGKAAILSTIFATAFFLIIQKKIGSAFFALAGICVLGAVIMLATPLSRYFTFYAESGEATTLTGRTDLWEASMPNIRESPVFGHGYMSAKFISEELGNTVRWEVTEMHNSYLQILYTNGIVGLGLLLMINLVIVKNLYIAVRHALTRDASLLAAGCLAIYAFLFLNSLVEAGLGGKASSMFLLLLGVLIVSEKLRRMAQPVGRAIQYGQLRPGMSGGAA